eukprot:4245535-Prymnesium_polylepis.1
MWGAAAASAAGASRPCSRAPTDQTSGASPRAPRESPGRRRSRRTARARARQRASARCTRPRPRAWRTRTCRGLGTRAST